MAELSQDEIDNLMGGDGGDTATATSTESEASGDESKNITVFDFRKPNRIPKEHKRTVWMVFQAFAQTVGLSLSAFLRTEVNCVLDEVEQVTFQEYTMSLMNPTCAATIDMQPLNGYGVIEVNPCLVFTILDRMLGGEGNVPEIARSFTDIELSIARKVVNMLLKDLGEAWQQLLRINYALREVHANPAFIRSIPAREACLTAYLKTDIGAASGLITVCIPYVNLEPIAGKLKNEQFNSRYSTRQGPELKEAHTRNFHKIPLDLSAILGTIDLSMQDLLMLQPGDILEMRQKVRDPITLRVAGEDKFLINPGLRGKHKAVAIQSELAKETNNEQ